MSRSRKQTVGRELNGTQYWWFREGTLRDRLAGASAITVAAWIRPGDGPEDASVVEMPIDEEVRVGLALGLTRGRKLEFSARPRPGDGLATATSDAPIPTGKWVQILAEVDFAANSFGLFVDGVRAHSPAVAPFGYARFEPTFERDTDACHSMIANGMQAKKPWKGNLAGLAFFRRLLSASEKSDLAAGGDPMNAAGGPPAVYFPMAARWDAGGAALRDNAGLIAEPVGYAPPCGIPAPLTVGDPPDEPPHVWRLVLRAADAGSFGDGNPVDAVPINGGAYRATAEGAARPTYDATEGALVFDGADDALDVDIGPIDPMRSTTVIAVFEGPNEERPIVSMETANTDLGVALSAGNGLRMTPEPGEAHALTWTDYLGRRRGIFAGRLTGQQLRNWLDGRQRTGGTVESGDGAFLSNGDYRPDEHSPDQIFYGARDLFTQPLTGRLVIGGCSDTHGTSPAHARGKLFELCLFFGAMTDEDIAKEIGRLAHAYGLAEALPADHPHKAAPPVRNHVPRIAPIDGLVIARSWRMDRDYIGTPNTCLRGNGEMLACHNVFRQPHTLSNIARFQTRIYKRSGERFPLISVVDDMWWARLWEHSDGNLYLIGSSAIRGDLVVARSTDGGYHWDYATLSDGSNGAFPIAVPEDKGYDGTSSGPLHHDGHVFFARRYNRLPFVFWAAADADLLDPSSWSRSNEPIVDFTATPRGMPGPKVPELIEPDLIVDRRGGMMMTLRITGTADLNTGMAVPVVWDGAAASLPPTIDNSHKFAMPGGNVMYSWSHDAARGRWLTVANTNDPDLAPHWQDQRNVAEILAISDVDFSKRLAPRSIGYLVAPGEIDDGMSRAEALRKTGMQYWIHDVVGDTWHLTTRAGIDGSVNHHDSNYALYTALDLTKLP